MADERDLRVEIRFANQRLYLALEEKFRKSFHPRYGLCSHAGKKIGVSANTIRNFLNLKGSPFYSRTKYHPDLSGDVFQRGLRPVAQKIADYLGDVFSAEELFPESLYALELPARGIRTFKSPEVLSLQEARRQHLLPRSTNDADLILERSLLHESTAAALKKWLTPRQQKVIEMRFGLDGEGEYTLQEVGQALSLSREGVRLREAKALRKLRRRLRAMH